MFFFKNGIGSKALIKKVFERNKLTSTVVLSTESVESTLRRFLFAIMGAAEATGKFNRIKRINSINDINNINTIILII